MCGYIGYEFGAVWYPDSVCIDGRLYDADNCDDDHNLYEPLEFLPCPACNTEQFLDKWREDVAESYDPRRGDSLCTWKAVIRKALKENREAAIPLLNGRFRTALYMSNESDDLLEYTFDPSEFAENAE